MFFYVWGDSARDLKACSITNAYCLFVRTEKIWFYDCWDSFGLQSWRCFVWHWPRNHRKRWVSTMVPRGHASLALQQMWAKVAKGSGQTRPMQDKPISCSARHLVWHAGLPWVSCWGSTKDSTDAGGHHDLSSDDDSPTLNTGGHRHAINSGLSSGAATALVHGVMST